MQSTILGEWVELPNVVDVSRSDPKDLDLQKFV
jgi:hypothetical protein